MDEKRLSHFRILPPRMSPAATVLLASALGLFLELAVIRWVSCEIRVFAYCKNLVLVASFLGFGVGCFLSRRRADFVRALFLLLLLALVVRLPWPSLAEYGPRRVTAVLAELSGFMIFRHSEAPISWGVLGRLAFAVGWTTALFLLVAAILVPFGQATAAGIAAMGRPLAGYSVNVAGSLLGILAYTLATSLGAPPILWFVPAALACLALIDGREHRLPVLGLTVALALTLLPSQTPAVRELWSSYQKLNVVQGRAIVVNNVGYQVMARQRVPTAGPPDRFTLPYLVRPGGRVLIVGAGSGNDAAAALLGGASSVTAVEIDPAIYRIGRELHPQRPYWDPRVRVVIDDARHFLKTSAERFDLVVFSHLDSHTLLSSFTNVRLDDYVYTREAFREARARLADGGVLYVCYFAELPFIGPRLARNLTEAFGHPPLSLAGVGQGELGQGWTNVYFLIGESPQMPRLEAAATGWERLAQAQSDTSSIVPSTDDWPFLPLESPQVPPVMALIAAVILGLSGAFAWVARPGGEAFDGRLFFLGAAFMLLEVHNVSRLALVFGTTWQVNAWVIGTILGLILLANAVCAALARRQRRPGPWAVPLLFLSLCAAYFVPLQALVLHSRAAGGLTATLLLSAPIFFAGLVFAEAFAETTAPGFGLGWNVLGAVLGGMAETLSYLWGISALVLLAGAFYAAAIAWPRLRTSGT